jgi:hypothetical protein
MDPNLVKEKIDRLNSRIKEVVMADGVISTDEQYILDKTKVSIEALKKFVDNNSKDKLERDKIKQLVTIIENDSLNAAEFDDLISEDEMAMLGVLFDSLEDIISNKT